MKFDLVFSNPPYTNNLDIKILNDIVNVADEFVVVHPSTWILDTKGKTKLYKEFINKINDKKCNFEFFNGNPVFDIDLFLPCVISHIQMNSQGESFMNYFGKTYNINDVFSVTKFGDKWKSLVLPFRQKIEKYISNSNSIWTHFSNNKTNSFSEGVGFLFQFPMGRGHSEISSNSKMLKDDFYSFFSSNQQEIDKKNKSQKVAFSGGTYYYFKTQTERDNFSEYLKTDFARFCLSLTKNNKHLDTGELELIPWLDFSEEWGDEKLFEKFEVSQELQNYIREFLPDFHGIRK